MTDEKILLTALKKSDKTAFEQLFQRYYQQVYSFCFSYLHQKEEAENIAQDVFFQLWIKKDTLDTEKSFSGFLFTITRNKILNHIRAEINRQTVLKEITKEKNTVTGQTDFHVSFNELKQNIDLCIGMLPPKRQEIFRLSRINGLSHSEISQQLNISIHTVESQITKALKYIRKALNIYLV